MEMVVVKKRKIQIDANGKSGYKMNANIAFALVSTPELGRKQITEFYTCRDFINDTMMSFYSNNGAYWNDRMPSIDTDNLRMLITSNVSNDQVQALYTAKRILNMYEKLAKFSQTSVMTRVDHPMQGGCWQLLGPGEWMISSNLVSMVTLIFRVVRKAWPDYFENVQTLDEAEANFKRFVERFGSDCDVTYLGDSWPKFRMFMKEFQTIFGQYTARQLHEMSSGSSWHRHGGISQLGKFDTRVKIIDEGCKKAWEKKGYKKDWMKRWGK
jgi:hypothetical protein